ncbi:MAG: choice-of-anchor D domain-containing protein, partial [Spartobacteria bacterium]|nr:choice-of-anchor D domain-containing protein [Spartobacteria bacterium]
VCIVDTTSDSGLTMYRNGTNVTANASLGYAFQRTNVMAIGAMRDPSYEFNGSLADIQIYKGLLTAQEVIDIRDSMKGVSLPGILVLGTNTNPVLSQSLPSINGGTDFGAMTNGAVADHTLTVTNTGENTLTLSAAALSGDEASAFTVSGLSGDIAEGGTTNFTVQFTATTSKLYQATLIMTNNAAQPYELALSGRGFRVSPNNGPAAGGTPITLESSPLGGDVTNVLIGGDAVTIQTQDADTVTITSPAGAAGTYDVVLQSPTLGTITLPSAYVRNPVGSIINVNPDSCTYTGGVEVLVVGLNMCATTGDIERVTLCGISAEVMALEAGPNNSQAVRVKAGSGGEGTGDVVVVSSLFGSNRLDNGFAYHTVPEKPVMQLPTQMEAISFTANWGAATYANGYLLSAAWNTTFTDTIPGYSNRIVGSGTSFAITNLISQKSSNVFVRVRGTNAIGDGPWSDVQQVTMRSAFTNVSFQATVVSTTTNSADGLIYVDFAVSNTSDSVLAEPYWLSAPRTQTQFLANPDGIAPDGNPYANITTQMLDHLSGNLMEPHQVVIVTNIPFFFYDLRYHDVNARFWAAKRVAWTPPVAADQTIRMAASTNYTGQLTLAESTDNYRQPLVYEIVQPPTRGGGAVVYPDGSFDFISSTSTGPETFTFRVSNIDGATTGTVTVVVRAQSRGMPWLMLLLGD